VPAACLLRGLVETGSGDWDYEQFLDQELEFYLQMTKEFMDEEFNQQNE
jgi:hypothetical protein